MGVRVYELARTLGLSSKILMHELKKQGIDLKSHMSSIDDETADLVAELLKPSPPPAVKEMPPAPPVVAERTTDPMITPSGSVSQEVVASAAAPPAPVVTREPTPTAVVEPPKVAGAVDTAPTVKTPPAKHLRLGEAVTVKELAE